MSRPFRVLDATVRYRPLNCEAVLVARTTERRPAVLRSALALGKMTMTAIYGFPPTPFSDDVLIGMKRLHLEDAVKDR